MSSSQILPSPEGPECTPCGCSHIEPEHEPDAGACLSCDCEAYRPAAIDQTAPPAAVWIDGDPLMEAIAAAVWEQCRTDYPSSVVDDPRNIAAVAAAAIRAHQAAEAPATDEERRERYATAISKWHRDPEQALYVQGADAVIAVADAEQAELRRERDLAIAHDRQPYPTAWAYEQACKALHRKEAAIERVLEFAASLDEIGRNLAGPEAVHPVAARIRHLLDTTAADAVLPAPADRAAVLREAADALDAYIARYRSPSIANWTGAVAFLRRMAVEAQQDAAHPPYDSWLVELQMDDGHWAVAYPTHDYDKALDRLTRRRTEHPDQQWRLVRETDTFTVVDPKPAVEAQQPTRDILCPEAFWRPQPHAPHDWQQGPDTQPVHCRGVAEAQQPQEAGERVVAYRSALPGAMSIYCTRHTDELGDGVMPLTSDDLPNGGLCAGCGADVLIEQQPKEARS